MALGGSVHNVQYGVFSTLWTEPPNAMALGGSVHNVQYGVFSTLWTEAPNAMALGASVHNVLNSACALISLGRCKGIGSTLERACL